MPVHDWSRVDAGIFHHFHHDWITELSRALNAGLLPAQYYAIAEQFAGGFGPERLALQPTAVVPPLARFTTPTDMEYYVRKQTSIVIRHASNDRVVALVEVVSPANKVSRSALRAFVEKATEVLTHDCHLLVLDLYPPGPHDPNGIHSAIWEEFGDASYCQPTDKPLTLAAYSAGSAKAAYVEPVAVGAVLPDMPLFLKPEAYINVPLEATYQAAWQGVPRRWRQVLEALPP